MKRFRAHSRLKFAIGGLHSLDRTQYSQGLGWHEHPFLSAFVVGVLREQKQTASPRTLTR